MLENLLAGLANGGEAQIVTGSVGWEDEDEYFFLGEEANDGHTLVRVQLFEGRDYTQPINPNRAQGHKIVCHLSGGLFRIPKKDTRVFVAVPKGMSHIVGAGVIFATIEKSPTTQFAEDRAVVDYGDDVHVVIKGKSVALQSPDNEFISVGTPRSGGKAGLTFQASDGTGGVIQTGCVGWFVAEGGTAKTIIQMTPTKIECTTTEGGYWKVDKDFYCLGTNVYAIGGAVYLGKAPTLANPVLWGLTGPSGAPSTSVFVSPT